MDLSGLVVKMIIFVVLMVIGYVCAKTGVAGAEFTKTTSKLVINVFMSATIINSVLNTELSLTGAELGQIMLVLSAALALCYALAALAAKLLPVEKEHGALFELLAAVPNNMFIALPVAEELFGPVAVFYCSLSCIPYNLILYTYGVWRLKSGGGERGIKLRDIISVPLVATLAALLIFLVKPPVPAVARELIGSLSGATMPLSMIVIGSSLGSVSLLDAFKNWWLYLSSFLRLLLAPALVWLVCSRLTADPVLLMTAVIIAASPGAVVVTVLTIQYGRDAVFTSEGILHSTVLSMLTIPAIVWLLI